MVAIQPSAGEFDERWIEYCKIKGIPYKLVDCYKNDIVSQLAGCKALLWQFHQGSPRDFIMAKNLLCALDHSGFKVFPDFRTAWHFDDKIGQKFLLESIDAPLVPTYIFYKKEEALNWAEKSEFPKVFKLRGGAGSQNVRLVKTRKDAKALIRKAFGRGFKSFNPSSSLKERWRRYKLHLTDLRDLAEGLARFIVPPAFARIRGREKGYVYFQEFIAGNNHDIRIIVIDDKAFGIKRLVRNNDFRASGSGNIQYDRSLFNEVTLKLAFELARKLKNQCVAFDFIYQDGNPLVVEISYGFLPKVYDPCPGYWDKELTWHEGKFNPYGWMVEGLLKQSENEANKLFQAI
jgi:glutathione synthase/RimK-type ligase-like ATP-grasp enzyme